MKSGVYKIVNAVNGKVYIGSAVNMKQRWQSHCRLLRHNIHTNSHLQSAWNKYGKANFEFAVVEECFLDCLIAREAYYIKEAKRLNQDVYNYMIPEGDRLTHSEETRQKLREARLRQGAVPHYPAKLFEHDGQLKSAKDWADHFGVNHTTFRQKLYQGRSVAEASRTKPKELRVEFDGEVLSLKDIADKTGISYSTLWSRMQTGISVEEALDKTSLKQIAQKNNINYHTFYGRLSRGMSVEEALALPVKRRICATLR